MSDDMRIHVQVKRLLVGSGNAEPTELLSITLDGELVSPSDTILPLLRQLRSGGHPQIVITIQEGP